MIHFSVYFRKLHIARTICQYLNNLRPGKLNNHKLLIFLVLLSGVLLSECKKESVQPPTDQEILGNRVRPAVVDEYIYPIQPGTIGWDTVQIHGNLYDMIIIPDTVLQKMSTWGLVETCFKYPLRVDCLAWNNPSLWINDISKNFNGLIELYSRADVAEILLYDYRYLDLKQYSYYDDIQYIELMVGCDTFVSKLNVRQLIYLTKIAIEKCKEQRELFDSFIYPQSIFIMGNAMVHAGYKPFIEYCSKNKLPVSPGFVYYRIGADYTGIEKYASDFVAN